MRKCPLSKTELQKAQRLFQLTGENRRMRRKKMRDAMTKASVAAATPALAPSTVMEPAPQTKADVLREKVDKEFAEKPRRKKA